MHVFRKGMTMRWTGAGTVLAVLLMVAACGEAPTAPVPSETADATTENAPGIALTDARVQLPIVSGRPGVAYFTVSQANGAPRKLTGVTVEMAGRAEMHTTEGGAMKPVREVALQPGVTVKFEPGGRHAMLFDLDPKLRFADAVDLTVTFDDGDKTTVKAPVRTMAEQMEHSN